jgi:hypothetical protein
MPEIRARAGDRQRGVAGADCGARVSMGDFLEVLDKVAREAE